jgi:hypothetical protein
LRFLGQASPNTWPSDDDRQARDARLSGQSCRAYRRDGFVRRPDHWLRPALCLHLVRLDRGDLIWIDVARKAAVTNPDRYEPGLNRSYLELADHYGTAIRPARPYKPRDKAKVEQSVLIAERWILDRLCNRRFFTIADLNVAIAELVRDINARLMKGFNASRAELFATIDTPALKNLQDEPYAFAVWKRCRVAPRLPRRSRRPLVFGALPSHQGTGRCARRRQDSRGILQEAACRQPSARAESSRPHHASRTHAGRKTNIRKVIDAARI